MFKKLLLVTLISIFLIPVSCSAEEPDYMRAEFSKSGYLVLAKEKPSGLARFLEVSLSIPQNTPSQNTRIVSVDGPDSYRMDEDQWGNQVLVLVWTDPGIGMRLDYEVVFDVKTSVTEIESPGSSFPETEFVKPNPEITKKSFELISGLEGTQKIFKLTEFVHSWLDYEEGCTNFTRGAAWAFKERRGTCDEFSNLLISMLRAVGFNAYYVVGYAYSEDWSAHGWVELEFQGKILSLDPTWLESPVDVTHIKLAALSDSNFTESALVKGSSISIDWNKNPPHIRTLEKKETERLRIRADIVPIKIGSKGEVLLITDLLTWVPGGCILDRIDARSCKDERGGDFLELSEKTQTVAFCGSQTLYWFIKSPKLEKTMVYSCPVLVYSGENEERATLTLDPQYHIKTELYLTTPITITPRENFTASINLRNTGSMDDVDLYLFFSSNIEKQRHSIGRGEEKSIDFPLEAPSIPGAYELIVFSSSGESVRRNLRVIEKRFLEFLNVSHPDQTMLGEDVEVKAVIENLEEKTSATLQVKLGEEKRESSFVIDQGEKKEFSFRFKPDNPGKNDISILLLSEGRYEDGWFGNIEIVKEETLFDSLMGWFGMIFEKIKEFLGLA